MRKGSVETLSARGDSIRGTIAVSEIFGPTVQGEGALIGKPTIFVRTGGCDYRCRWCDSKFAVLPEYRDDWRRLSPQEIFTEIKVLSSEPIMVTLSGGNPALQPLGALIRLGKAEGYRFAIETQGTVARDWFRDLDYLTISPKPPSSGMQTDWNKLAYCAVAGGPKTEALMKVVVFDDADYAYTKEVASRFPDLPMYLQVGNDCLPEDGAEPDPRRLLDRYEWLVSRVVADGWNDATVLPQLHTLVWGNKRGV